MQEKIKSAFKQEFNEFPDSVERMTDGLKQETFSVEVDGNEYIIQFLEDDYKDHNSLEHCLNCYKILQDFEIPVPRIITEQVREIEGKKYSIVEKGPGESMEQNISPEKVTQSGKMLAKIHNFRDFESEGWIKFEEDGMKTVDFEESSQKQKNLKELKGNIRVFREEGFEEIADKMQEFSEKASEFIPEEVEPVFCHDDFSPDNIIWKNGEITGVIDFDTAYAGDRFRNITHSANAFWMHDPGADWNIREKFYEGYRTEKNLGEKFDKLEPVYRVQTLIGLIAGMIKLDELSEDEKEFYEERILKQLSNF